MLWTILIIILILVLLGGLPGTPWMSGSTYGYWPSGIVGMVVLVLVVLLLLGRL